MITVIPNQPIRLRDSNTIDTSCECLGQSYCQLINIFDNTQFQIRSSNLVSNGTFATDLTGWNVYLGITIDLVSFINTIFGQCDGSVVASASGGTGPYEYSIDGGEFQVSGTFIDLCQGNHYIIAKDVDGNEGILPFETFANIGDCSFYAGSTLQDLIDSNITLGQTYNCTLGDFQ